MLQQNKTHMVKLNGILKNKLVPRTQLDDNPNRIVRTHHDVTTRLFSEQSFESSNYNPFLYINSLTFEFKPYIFHFKLFTASSCLRTHRM